MDTSGLRCTQIMTVTINCLITGSRKRRNFVIFFFFLLFLDLKSCEDQVPIVEAKVDLDDGSSTGTNYKLK